MDSVTANPNNTTLIYPNPNWELLTVADVVFWIAEKLSTYNQLLQFFEIFISVFGIFLNAVTIDVASKLREKTSGGIWMQLLALWDAAYLMIRFFKEVLQQATGFDMRNTKFIWCRFYRYILYLVVGNVSSHLVMMAVDRAINITFPIWHYRRKWSTLIPIISLTVTFAFLTLSISYFELNIEGGVCGTDINPSLRIIRIAFGVFMVITHFGGLLASNVVFIYQLRIRKTPKIPGKRPRSKAVKTVSKRIDPKCNDFLAQKRTGMSMETIKPEDVKPRSGNISKAPPPNLTDFIYSGPDSGIPTNYVTKKASKDARQVVAVKNQPTSINACSSNFNKSNDKRQESERGTGTNYDTTVTMETNFSGNTLSNNAETEDADKHSEGHSHQPSVVPSNKPSPNLTPEDRQAVRTVLYICFWYFICMCSAVGFLQAQSRATDRHLKVEVPELFSKVSHISVAINCSLNFFFYIRGASFRNTFKSRYLS